MIEYEYSDLFLQGSTDKQWEIKYGDRTIRNDNLFSESIELTESLCSGSELRFGCCEASVLKFKVANIVSTLKGKWLATSVIPGHKSDKPFSIGRHKVNSDKLTADKQWREIVAYDAMYDIINSDVADWYNTVLPESGSEVTMKRFRTSFAQHFGLEQADAELVNDSMIVKKTIFPSQLSGKDVITAICEINGCFGHIGRDGKLHYIYLERYIEGLYPANDLYPSDDLFPADPKSTRVGQDKSYKSCKYEDFVTAEITRLQVRQTKDDVGAVYPEGELSPDDNCYIIEDNFLVYGKEPEELLEITKNIFDKISGISYRPFDLELRGNPCFEVGDAVRVSTKYELVETYILERNMKGIQAIMDSFSAKGVEKYAEPVNSINSSIVQLKGKTNELERTVEETRSTITNVEEGLQSQITQNAGLIEQEVTQREEGEIKLSSKIEQTAGSIVQEIAGSEQLWYVQEDDGKKIAIDVYGYGDPPNLSSDEFTPGMKYLDQTNGIVYAADMYVNIRPNPHPNWYVYKRLTSINADFESRISQSLSKIELSVKNNDAGTTAGITITAYSEDGTPTVSPGEIILTGLVSFTDLSSDGKTQINGGNIMTKTLSCDSLNGGTITGQKIEGGTINGTQIVASVFDAIDKIKIRNLDGTKSVTLEVYGDDNAFLGINKSVVIEKNLTAGNIEVIGNLRLRKTNETTGNVDNQEITALYKDGGYHDVITVSSNLLTTGIGWSGNGNDNKSYSTTLNLRGKTVTAPNNGGVSVSSDERLKNSFKPLDEFDKVYMDIKPCAFKYNNGTSGRFHFGARAQDVKNAFEGNGFTTQDFGGFVQMRVNPEDEDYDGIVDPMGLIYTEFTMWNMHMVQKLYEKVDELEKKIFDLERR